ATGLVLIGENQAAIGEAVITAARLRDITPRNSVTVTASTRKLLGDMFVYDDSQFDRVLGPVTTYEVTRQQAIEMRFVAGRRRGCRCPRRQPRRQRRLARLVGVDRPKSN